MCWIVTGAVLVNIYVSGSRSAFVSAAISLFFAMLSGIVMTNREQKLRSLLLPGVISVVGALFYVFVFTSAYESMVERQSFAEANEGSILNRSTRILTEVIDVLPRSSLIGYGIGMGSNAGAVLATGVRRFQLSESELPGIVVEAGLPGLVYIGFRFWLVGYMLIGSLAATRRSNNPLPLMFFSFAGVTLLVGQITLQGTVNGYGWLFAGFCMAANELGRDAPRPLLRSSPGTRRRAA
jgi:O-antigen ligase